jgi:GNAT superfamily N-acetyltransferase
LFEPPDGVFLVVRGDDEEPVGCGGIRRLPDGPAGIRYEVKHLFLEPATRGRGWGRLLLDELERYARGWGAVELVLDTHHTLEAAGGLYASSGFVTIEPYNDNPNATRWYGKTL